MPEHARWWRHPLSNAWRCLAEGGALRALCRTLVVAALLGLGALAFVAAGLVPIAASDGHWAATRSLLEFAMRRAVHTRTLGMQAPSLGDPALVLKGAGHYATGCMPCHGAPGEPRAAVVLGMTPKPPPLVEGTGTLDDAELFWIVRHGIKYTAMPAWPAPVREDEVWAMVAFLRALPSMDAVTFRALAHGDAPGATASSAAHGLSALSASPATGASGPLEVVGDCMRCHGRDGQGRGDAIPRLAGLPRAYLEASLHAFARGERHSGIMQPVAAGLSRREMRDAARYFARLSHPGAPGTARARCPDPDAAARGADLAHGGDPARKVPACVGCHGGPDRNPLYPPLHGQPPTYLALQLRLFRDGHRGGTPYAGVMEAAARHLTDADIDALAAHYRGACTTAAAPSPG